jgi:hypothetical protein
LRACSRAASGPGCVKRAGCQFRYSRSGASRRASPDSPAGAFRWRPNAPSRSADCNRHPPLPADSPSAGRCCQRGGPTPAGLAGWRHCRSFPDCGWQRWEHDALHGCYADGWRVRDAPAALRGGSAFFRWSPRSPKRSVKEERWFEWGFAARR